MHPLLHHRCEDFVVELNDLIAKNSVQSKRLNATMTIYKYKDQPKILGLARLARGLIIEEKDGAFSYVNLPMPKFDEIAAFDNDMMEYHRNIKHKLPAEIIVQPKHDGTCVHAVWYDGRLVVSTFLSNDNPQSAEAYEILKDSKWDDNVTLAFELISDKDPKTQIQRAQNGLYLFYGARSDGSELSRQELEGFSRFLPVNLVKQQKISKTKLGAMLSEMDQVDTCSAVKEGLVVYFDGQRHKVKSWLYLFISNKILPNKTWLRKVVCDAKLLDEVHESVETFTGPLDSALMAHYLLIGLISEVKDFIVECIKFPYETIEEIQCAPKKIQSVLHQCRKQNDFLECDAGVLKIMKMFVR